MMTIDEMERCLAKMRLVVTQWAPPEISREMASTWLSLLKEFSDVDIKNAFAKAAVTFTRWPSLAEIKRLCQGSFKDDEEHGEEISSRIEGAIRNYGYTNPKRAEIFIGPLGWQVVRQCGGWNSICEIESDQLPSSRRQWREVATVISKNFHFIGKNLPPEIPQEKNPALQAALQLISNRKEK